MGYEDIKKHYDCYRDKVKCNTTLENGMTDDVLDQLCQLQTELENGGIDDLLFDIYDKVSLSTTAVSEDQYKEMGNTDNDIMEMRKLDTLVENGINITGYFDEKEPEVVVDRKNTNNYIDDSVDNVSVGESAITDNNLVLSDKSMYIDDDIDDIEETENTNNSDMGYIDDDTDEDVSEVDEDTAEEEYIDDDIDDDIEDIGSSAIEFNDEEDYIDDDIDEVAEDSAETEGITELLFDNNDNYVDDDVDEDSIEVEENAEISFDNNDNYVDDDVDEDSAEERSMDYREQRMEELRSRRMNEMRDRREQLRSRHRPDYDYEERRRRRDERYERRHYDDDGNRGINVNNDNKFVQNSDEPVINGKPNDIVNSDNKCIDEKLADLLLRISNGILTSPQTVKKSLSKLRVTDDDITS